MSSEAAAAAIGNGKALYDRTLRQHDCPGPCGGKVPDTQYACLEDWPGMALELPDGQLSVIVDAALDCIGSGHQIEGEPHEILRLVAEVQHHRAVWAATAGVLAEVLEERPGRAGRTFPTRRQLLDVVTDLQSLIDPTLEGILE